jgi:hypothetical protein
MCFGDHFGLVVEARRLRTAIILPYEQDASLVSGGK